MLHVFIINSFAGGAVNTADLREKIEQHKDLSFLIFNAEYQSHETVLAQRICDLFPEEKIRFYACGGSGTFRNVMNGIDDFSRVELVEYALGLTNDFLSVFDAEKRFKDLDALIHGKTVWMDYFETNQGSAHNTLSVGIDVSVIKSLELLVRNPFFHGKHVYFFMEVIGVFISPALDLDVLLDGVDYSGSYYQFVVGNGTRLGGIAHFPEAENSPQDGKAQILMMPKKNFLFKIRAFLALLWKDEAYIRKHFICRSCRQAIIARSDGRPMEWNFDGELVETRKLHVKVQEKKMQFIVPDGVQIKGKK